MKDSERLKLLKYMNYLKVIRADNRTIIIVSIFILPLFIGFSYLNFVSGGVFLPMYFIAVVYGSVYYTIKKIRIEIRGDILFYKTPFSKVKKIDLHDVDRVSVDIGSDLKDRKKRYSIFRLSISPVKSSCEEIIINLKLFRIDDIAFLLDKIKSTSSEVIFDDLSKELLVKNHKPLTSIMINKILRHIPIILLFIIIFIIALSLLPK